MTAGAKLTHKVGGRRLTHSRLLSFPQQTVAKFIWLGYNKGGVITPSP